MNYFWTYRNGFRTGSRSCARYMKVNAQRFCILMDTEVGKRGGEPHMPDRKITNVGLHLLNLFQLFIFM